MNTLGLAVLSILAGATPSVSAAQASRGAEDSAWLVTMRLPDYRAFLASHGALDRLYCQGDLCGFLVDDRQLEKLSASGLRFDLSRPAVPQMAGPSLAGGDPNGLYHDYGETTARLFELQALYPELARVVSLGRSLEGREIYSLKISDNVGVEENEPNVYVTGCHHAREWISVEVPLAFAAYLLDRFDDDAEVARAVRGAQIYLTPILNPDGLEFSVHTYRLWRKNRRYNGDLAWGVDINRNYGFAWGLDDHGSSPDPNSEIFRGASAFSEPETRALRDFMLAHPPSGALSYHNYSQTILYPWGYRSDPAPGAAVMQAIGEEMSRRMRLASGRLYTVGPGATTLYLTNGAHDDWVYASFGAPSFTVELPPDSALDGGFYTSQAEIARVMAENNPAILYFVNYFVTRAARSSIE